MNMTNREFHLFVSSQTYFWHVPVFDDGQSYVEFIRKMKSDSDQIKYPLRWTPYREWELDDDWRWFEWNSYIVFRFEEDMLMCKMKYE